MMHENPTKNSRGSKSFGKTPFMSTTIFNKMNVRQLKTEDLVLLLISDKFMPLHLRYFI